VYDDDHVSHVYPKHVSSHAVVSNRSTSKMDGADEGVGASAGAAADDTDFSQTFLHSEVHQASPDPSHDAAHSSRVSNFRPCKEVDAGIDI